MVVVALWLGRLAVRVYRWDLDKTYLQTDFESLRGLVRSATEPARAKRAVPGATALIRALGEDPEGEVRFLSGSPEQMRGKLEAKLHLDGVPFEELVLKDSVGHIRRGELRALVGQFGYKLPALLRSRAGLDPAARETLFGDDVEVDALVYAVYADAVAGRIGPAEVREIMELAGAYPEHIEDALGALEGITKVEAVERIFIRLEHGIPPHVFAPLGRRVVPVHSWWQAALVLASAGILGPEALGAVLGHVVEGERRDSFQVAALTQDIVRRGHVRRSVLDQVPGPEAMVVACREAIGRLPARPIFQAPVVPAGVDHRAVLLELRAWRGRR